LEALTLYAHEPDYVVSEIAVFKECAPKLEQVGDRCPTDVAAVEMQVGFKRGPGTVLNWNAAHRG
jgi:hypothetical protein